MAGEPLTGFDITAAATETLLGQQQSSSVVRPSEAIYLARRFSRTAGQLRLENKIDWDNEPILMVEVRLCELISKGYCRISRTTGCDCVVVAEW